MSADARERSSAAGGYGAWLAGAALVYSIAHHLGSIPEGLGAAPRGTRWGDWLDLFIPYLVLAPAAVTLHRAVPSPTTGDPATGDPATGDPATGDPATGRVTPGPPALAGRSRPSAWVRWLFGVGTIAYTSGHGIHLAANSIGNVTPGTDAAPGTGATPGVTAHLWDEAVGHQLWYAGVALVVAALAVTMLGRPRPAGPLPHALALAVGLTWVTNVLGGEGTAVPGLLLALLATGFGWARRDGLPIVMVVAGGAATTVLTAVLISRL